MQFLIWQSLHVLGRDLFDEQALIISLDTVVHVRGQVAQQDYGHAPAHRLVVRFDLPHSERTRRCEAQNTKRHSLLQVATNSVKPFLILNVEHLGSQSEEHLEIAFALVVNLLLPSELMELFFAYELHLKFRAFAIVIAHI